MNNRDKMVVESYSRLKHLKLVGEELTIPWQTVYVILKRNGIKVCGDKARYGSVSDRVSVIGESLFKKSVPIAIDNNESEFQSTIDFEVNGVTVDVKTSLEHQYLGRSKAKRWAFCISKQKDCADFFVLYALDPDKNAKHVFIIPREIATTSKTISIPSSGKSKWFDYKVDEKDMLEFFQSF